MTQPTMDTTVLIIGGGATGTGLARDLALRGVPGLLLERRDVAAGASGANHGLLHSGGRYVDSDPLSARECHEEADILRAVAPQCIEDSGGLFVAVDGDDERYAAGFPTRCAAAGVFCREIDAAEARALEPALAERLVAAYEVRDGAVDPFMLALDNLAHARALGFSARRSARVDGFEREGRHIVRTLCTDMTTGESFSVHADIIVLAAGAWSGALANMAGADAPVLASQGTLAVTQDRIARRVVNRLRKPSDADILVPGGTVSILGTTSVRIPSPDHCRPTVAEVDRMIDDARAMIPELETTRYIRAYAGVRPLASHGGGGGDRDVSRGFDLVDHEMEGIANLVSIVGGKLTTYRLMAEKTADLVCAKLGRGGPCRTATEPLPPSGAGHWTRPGRAARAWALERQADDIILCECEMVSRDVVTAIAGALGPMRGRSMLNAIGLRSRVGKGPCQGGFCGPRVTAHLYDMGLLRDGRGIPELADFIQRRWRGKAPVLWGLDLMQAELQEALHCGVFELELEDREDTP